MPVLQGKKILLIDDTKLVFTIISKFLEGNQCLLSYVQDPTLAQEEIDRIRPDLIILDLEMPKINGFELCELIKKNAETKEIPIVFSTSANTAKTIEKAFAAGAEDYVSKPVCQPELLSRLNRIFQNQTLKKDLQRNYREQAAVARVLSHDLNNYISTIKLSVQNLRRIPDLHLAENPLATKACERMDRTVLRMEELLLNARKMQSLEDEKMDFSCEAFSIADLVNECISNFQDKIEAKKISVKSTWESDSKNLAGPEGKVMLEPVSALNSVLGNVLSNAIKFSSRGSNIEIAAESTPKTVILKVRDHGVGMDEELRNKVFSRTEKTTRLGTENEAGSGLGMPLVKMFMEKYGGRIDIQSTSVELNPQDHGTTVIMEFQKAS